MKYLVTLEVSGLVDVIVDADSEDEAAGIAEQYTRIDPPELDWVECRATNVEEV